MMGERSDDASRLLLSRLVIDHRLRPRDPMSLEDVSAEATAAKLLLDENVPTLAQAQQAVTA